MSDSLFEINLCDIDISDERYKISFSQKDINFLAQSIKVTGLICPPTVRPVNNKFVILSGFNRVKALISNNQGFDDKTKIVVYKTKPDITDYECLLTSITAIAFQRPLTHAELIICLKRLYQFIDIKEITKKSPVIFNMELNKKFIEDLFVIGDLPDPALELIHKGNLTFKSAKRLAGFESDTIKVFLDIFSNIKASSNKQLEIILYIMEITSRDAIVPKIFFESQTIQDILNDKDKEPGIKTNDLRAHLFEKRFPTIFKIREMAKKTITSIKLGKNIRFLPPENFESQNYSISFTAKNFKEYKSKVDKLSAALENKELKEILNQ